MPILKYNNKFIIKIISEKFPNFLLSGFYSKKNEEWDTVFMEDFSDFIKEEFRIGNLNLVIEALRFVNIVINNPASSEKLKNLFVITLFEPFTQDKFISEFCKKVLVDEALSLFLKTEEDFGSLKNS